MDLITFPSEIQKFANYASSATFIKSVRILPVSPNYAKKLCSHAYFKYAAAVEQNISYREASGYYPKLASPPSQHARSFPLLS